MTRRATTVVAGFAVAAVSGCGAATVSSSAAPPALRLVDNGTVALGAPAMAGGDAGFVLRTTLPTTPPAPAPVYHLPTATAADAAAVASALGMAGRPVPTRGGWVARHGAYLLGVRTDGNWT